MNLDQISQLPVPCASNNSAAGKKDEILFFRASATTWAIEFA